MEKAQRTTERAPNPAWGDGCGESFLKDVWGVGQVQGQVPRP